MKSGFLRYNHSKGNMLISISHLFIQKKRRKDFIITFIDSCSEVTLYKDSFKQCCDGTGCRGGKRLMTACSCQTRVPRMQYTTASLHLSLPYSKLSAEHSRGCKVLLLRLLEGVEGRQVNNSEWLILLNQKYMQNTLEA